MNVFIDAFLTDIISLNKFCSSWLLVEVEFIALHGDVFSHIFISVHASSEQLVRFWSLNECLCSSEEQGNNVGGLLVHF
jgi:hypothetical protein